MRRTVMIRRLTILAAMVLAMLAFASPAWAATFTVDRSNDPGATGACTLDPNDCSLRQAISSANGTTGADTIDFASGISTVTLTATGIDNSNVSGDLDIMDDLTINGGTSDVIIEGGPGWNERVIDIFGAATTGNSTDVTIADATIRNGNAIFAVGSGSSFGGGIRVNANATLGDVASLTLRRSTVTGNHADQLGGGIYDEFESDITLEDSTVSNNTSGGSGGIHVRGSLTMANSTVSGNESDVLGGGIAAGSGTTVTMTESTMSGNTAKNQDGGSDAGGGGIYMTGATVTLTDSTVSGNTAEGCDFCRGLGGGIYVDSGTLNLANTTFSGNTAESGDSSDADGEGGGIYKLSGATTLSNSTVAFNTAGAAGTGGAGGGVFSTSMGSFTFRNSILALNNADLQSEDLAGTYTSEGYNLLGEFPGPLAPTDTVNPAPLLGPLANNGGSTMTHALQTGSPAIDAANPAAPGSGGTACEATDQRGETRPQDGDGDSTARCDIGAFEKAGGGGGGDTTPPTVFNVSPTGTGIPRTTNVTITFSEAMDAAFLNNDTIKLTRGTTSIPFTMTTNTDGLGRTVLTLNPFGSTTQKLGKRKTYTVTVEGTNPAGDSFAVRDAAGNELTQDHVSTFRTKRR